MAVKWIFLWMGPGLSKVEVIHCLVRGRRTPENRPRCLLQRGQGNFKLAANFGYSSRGSADPRESLRKRRILKLALTAHTVLPTPGARLLLLSTDISTTPALLLHPIATSLLPICSPHNPFRGQHPESPHLPDKNRQPFAGALSRDEIQSLEELDSERLSANWHHSSS